jgi:heme exporter protein CcmD
MLGGYAAYVRSAYGIVAVGVAGLIAKALIDGRRLQAELARIEPDRGGRR